MQVGFQVKHSDTTPRHLYVQVGYRANLDDTITWTARTELHVQGDGNTTTKVNPGGAGRFIRLRFVSDEANVQWRVSHYVIFARKGNSF